MTRVNPVAAPLWASLTLHAAIFTLASGLFWGSTTHLPITPLGRSFGGIAIQPIDTIPLPRAATPDNPIAGEPQPRTRVPIPDANAVPLPHRDPVPTDGGSRISTPMLAIPQTGPALTGSPFGPEFATYARLIQDGVARAWIPGTSASASPAIVRFTILRDGTIRNVTIAQSSGNISLDRSAERAVWDARLPALPIAFPRSQADVELRFEVEK
jgi:TonB family protein